jgi:hypothetical protein
LSGTQFSTAFPLYKHQSGPAPENQTENFALLRYTILHSFPVVQAPSRALTRKPNGGLRPSQVHNSPQRPRCTSTNQDPHPKTKRRISPFSGTQFSTAFPLYKRQAGPSPENLTEDYALLRYTILHSVLVVQAPPRTHTRKPNGEFRPSQVHNSPQLSSCTSTNHYLHPKTRRIMSPFSGTQFSTASPLYKHQPWPSPENQTVNFALLRYTILHSVPVAQPLIRTRTRKPNGEFRPSQVQNSPQLPRCTSTNQDPHPKTKRIISPFSGTQFSTASPLYKHQSGPSPENQTENFAFLRFTILHSFPVVQALIRTRTRKPNGEFRPSQVHNSPQLPRCTSTNQDPHPKTKRRISPFSGTQFSTASTLYKH